MSTKTLVRDEHGVVKDVDVKPAEVLSKVIERVRRDSKQETRRYLEESTVPHGGE